MPAIDSIEDLKGAQKDLLEAKDVNELISPERRAQETNVPMMAHVERAEIDLEQYNSEEKS